MKNTIATKTQTQFSNGIFYGGLQKQVPAPKPEPKIEPKPKIHLPSGTFH